MRVATAHTQAALLANLNAAQVRQATAGAQVSSEKKASDLKGYASDMETLAASRAIQARLNSYVENVKTLSARLETQDLALSRVESAAIGAKEDIATAVSLGRADALMAALEGRFGDAAQALNTTFAGKPVFGGGRIDADPVTGDRLSDLTAAGAPASLFTDEGVPPATPVDDGVQIRAGVRASEVGTPLFAALKRVKDYNDGPSGPLSGTLTQAQQDFLTSVMTDLTAARTTATDALAMNGMSQKRAENAEAAVGARQNALDGVVEGVTGVNQAEAITRLQQAGLAVQAAAQVITTLRQTSLLDLLR